MTEISIKTIDGRKHYSIENRGIAYTLSQNDHAEWELISKRKAMSTDGQFRIFASLEALESTLKAFRGIGAVIQDLDQAH